MQHPSSSSDHSPEQTSANETPSHSASASDTPHQTQQPYGSWPSVINAAMVAANSPRLSDCQIEQHRLFWCESLAEERGRVAIMMHDGQRRQCLLPAPLSARSGVHEYGGGAYCVAGDTLYFVLADDQRIYRADIDKDEFLPRPLTPEHAADGGQLRFADLSFDSRRQRLIAVCEHHHDDAAQTVDNTLVAIPIDGSAQLSLLAQGDDFYANPRLSPDGEHLSFLSWNHPDMPWDNTALWLARFDHQGKVSALRHLAGHGHESIFQPEWSPQGELYFVSDRNNWWNLYRLRRPQLQQALSQPQGQEPPQAQHLLDDQAEYATPQWTFGMSTYGFIEHEGAPHILACCTRDGLWQLVDIAVPDTDAASARPVACPSTHIESLVCAGTQAVFIGASATQDKGIYRWQAGDIHTLQAPPPPVDIAELSHPQSFTFATSEQQQAHALFYPPHNRRYCNTDAAPPLIVLCHGGPTGASGSQLNLKIQFWTQRGFAVVDVNYRGSSGYGREFRHRLLDQWGVYDVDDVCAVVEALSAQGRVDPQRCVIKGSSAGGYTVLAALAFRDTFKAGVSLYGIGDLAMLAEDTHKFEARYLDKLVGPYPQQQARYRARSPLHHIDNIRCPLLLFQGLQDKVVPPAQAEAMYQAVRAQGLTARLVTYEHEGHGFRDQATIEDMLTQEWAFYAEVFGFALTKTDG